MIRPSEFIFLSGSQKTLLESGTGIFCYHYLGIAPHKSNDPYLYVKPHQFRSQMEAFRKGGYEAAKLGDISNAVEAGSPKKIVLTVDDGAKNFFDHGLPVLAEFGFHAIQFIVPSQIGGINEWDAKHGHPVIPLMDEGQIREWIAEGHEIGSHSINHRNLSKLAEKDARAEIIDSKKQLEDRFGVPIHHFSYPHGKFNPLIRDLVMEAGYQTACTTRFGVSTAERNLMELPRIQPLSRLDLVGKTFHRVCKKLRLAP